MADATPLRIHLYRPQNQLGDLLLNVPAVRLIRDRYPRAHVTLVAGRQNAAAVLDQPWADRVRVVDTRNFVGVLRGSMARGPRPDIAVYFTTVSYSRSGAFLARRSGAPLRIGFDPVRYAERDRAGLTRAVAYPPGAPHQSEVSLALARAAIAAVAERGHAPAAGPEGAVPPPPYYVPDPALLARGPAGAVYVHPGAGKLKNRWPADRFAAVVTALLSTGRDVLLIEGPQDAGTTAAVSAASGRALPVVRGETIPMLAARFARAALYVGNDTGPLHLAGAVGCPTVGIYGWSDPREWKPVGRCVRTVRAADHSLESIPASDVLDAAIPLLTEESCATG
ncbi:MAG: glycosyltransferase family 9 protein [Hyphomicrobiales bacterium]